MKQPERTIVATPPERKLVVLYYGVAQNRFKCDVVQENCVGVAQENCSGAAQENYFGVAQENYFGAAQKKCVGVAQENRFGTAKENCFGGVQEMVLAQPKKIVLVCPKRVYVAERRVWCRCCSSKGKVGVVTPDRNGLRMHDMRVAPDMSHRFDVRSPRYESPI